MKPHPYQDRINANKRAYIKDGQLPRQRWNINRHNSPEHEQKKAEIMVKLQYEGCDVWTEVQLKTGSIADVIVMDVTPPHVVEILKSETDKDFVRKNFGICTVEKVKI